MDKTVKEMRKIYTIVFLLAALVLGSCSDFLDETTDKSGSAYIYHMDRCGGNDPGVLRVRAAVRRTDDVPVILLAG